MAITVGASSTFFGFMYGSIFGFEHILPAIWLSPMHNINRVLLVAVGIGVGFVLLGICLGIANNINNRNYHALIFGANSVSGLLFYIGAPLGFVVHFAFFGLTVPFVVTTLYAISTAEEGCFASLIHTFESLLSYATNTLSFIRVGAIVLSHSAMMGAVFLLSRNLNIAGSILAVGIGNVIVMAVEILVVGIQALRLNYYEMFSRFYTGGGKPFTPLRDK